MNKSNESRLLLSDTAVPDAFIMQYVQELSKEAVGIYLWILMSGIRESFTLEKIYEYSALNKQACNDAIAELIQHELAAKKSGKNNETFYLIDLKQKEVDDYVKLCMAKGINNEGLKLTADEKLRNQLADSISKNCYLGKMPYQFYRLIDKCLYEYGFEDLVIYKLFDIGKENKFQFKFDKMKKLAEDWYNRGYVTSDKLSDYINKQQEIKAVIAKMGYLYRNQLNGIDLERINRWVCDLGVTEDLAEFAFRANDFRPRITMKNVEDTLVKWVGAGVTTVEAATEYEQNQHNENKRKATRKSGKSGSWKTGAEAGLLDNTESESKASQSGDANTSTKGKDILLDLFGDDSEDD